MNVLLIYLTNLFYRYNTKIAYKCRNARTNGFFKYNLFDYLSVTKLRFQILYLRKKIKVYIFKFHFNSLPQNLNG